MKLTTAKQINQAVIQAAKNGHNLYAHVPGIDYGMRVYGARTIHQTTEDHAKGDTILKGGYANYLLTDNTAFDER